MIIDIAISSIRKKRPPMREPMIIAVVGFLCEFAVALGEAGGVGELPNAFSRLPTDSCEEDTYGKGKVSDSPIAELRTSIAESWPHGYIWGTEGPSHRGEYQFVLGERALFCNALYCFFSDETYLNRSKYTLER